MTRASSAAAPGGRRWGQAPFAFELQSDDQEVLARAGVVFRPWRLASRHTASVQSWTVCASPGLDSWQVRRTPRAAAVSRSTVREAVTLVEVSAVSAVIDGPPEVLTLHAALVSRGGDGVLILGPNEAGKSTLACGVWCNGGSLLGDDVAIVDTSSARASSAPRRVSLRAPSRSMLGESLWAQVEAAPATDVAE